MGDIVVSGIPCVDFSTYGKHRGLAGPTGSVVVVWTRLIQIHAPLIFIIEEVKPFLNKCLPMLLREDMFGGMYSFTFETVDPRLLNLPISRPRLYCIAVRKDVCASRRPRVELRAGLPPVRPLTFTGHDYFFMPESSMQLTLHLKQNLMGYRKIFGRSAFFYLT